MPRKAQRLKLQNKRQQFKPTAKIKAVGFFSEITTAADGLLMKEDIQCNMNL